MFSKLVILVLLAVTLGLYLKIVMMDDPEAVSTPLPQASIQVVESDAPAESAPATGLRAVPEDQMAVIREVFAPELSDK